MPRRRKFRENIFIMAEKGNGLYDDAVEMEKEEGDAFIKTIYVMLQTLESKPLGRQLIEEIERTLQPVKIFAHAASGSGRTRSVTAPCPANAANEFGRFILLRQIPDDCVKQVLAMVGRPVISTDLAQYAALVHQTIERSGYKREMLPGLLGITATELSDVEHGRARFSDTAYGRFAMLMYAFLDPGPGCSVSIRFDVSEATSTDPGFIILGHELIHAWRMVTGMRIFPGQWEEEAMTTGIPPFVTQRITENKLRAEHSVAPRGSYTAVCCTGHYRAVSTCKGVWPETMRKYDAWLKKEASQRSPGSAAAGPRVGVPVVAKL